MSNAPMTHEECLKEIDRLDWIIDYLVDCLGPASEEIYSEAVEYANEKVGRDNGD